MSSQNGAEYAQNYDVIVKWMAEAFRGETLDVLGIFSGRIEEVFGFEPVDIANKAGRVDVMARDEKGNRKRTQQNRGAGATLREQALSQQTDFRQTVGCHADSIE